MSPHHIYAPRWASPARSRAWVGGVRKSPMVTAADEPIRVGIERASVVTTVTDVQTYFKSLDNQIESLDGKSVV